MEIQLLKELEYDIRDQKQLAETLEINITQMFSEDCYSELFETAHAFLGKVAAAITSGKQNVGSMDVDNTAALLAALRAVGSADTRDAFNISKENFRKIIQLANDDPKVTKYLIQKIAYHPSNRTNLEKAKKMLTSFAEADDNTQKATLNKLNRLRMGYERTYQKLAATKPASHEQQNQTRSSATASADASLF